MVMDWRWTKVCVPVGACGEVAEEIAAHLKAGAILTDAGSVKNAVVKAVAPHVPQGVHFIPGHPIAGTEESGPESGFAELFEGRWCVLTPPPGSGFSPTPGSTVSPLRIPTDMRN